MIKGKITVGHLKDIKKLSEEAQALPTIDNPKPKQNDKKISREARKLRFAKRKELLKLLHEKHP